MKTWLTIGALFATFIATEMNAMAEEKLRKNERYCLETGGRGGGSRLCRYETMAQCIASKTGNSDNCYQNPGWGWKGK